MKNLIIRWFVKWLIAILPFLAGCSPLRHYQKVALDPFRNAAERSLLSRACTQEFPNVLDTPRVISTGIDSSDYLAVVDAYNQLIDSLIAQGERDKYQGYLVGDDLSTGTFGYSQADSLRIIRNFIRVYHPPAVIKTEVKEIFVTNTAAVEQVQAQVDVCRTENAALSTSEKKAIEKLGKRTTTVWWLAIVTGLLAIGNGYQLFSKKRIINS